MLRSDSVLHDCSVFMGRSALDCRSEPNRVSTAQWPRRPTKRATRPIASR